jgi:Fanconi anemia group M protein
VAYISHPLVKENSISIRDYQVNIAASALERSTLVVLPTGMGKTVIALLVIINRLSKGKILFLAPTKPLVNQHWNFLRDHITLDPETIGLLTGEVPPQKRRDIWDSSRIVVSTPQTVRNDLESFCSLSDFSLAVFDEAHRAVGDYAYVPIAQTYLGMAKALTLGITASPGSTGENIMAICNALGIENIEIRGMDDPDVKPYVHEIRSNWVKVKPTDEIKDIALLLKEVEDDLVQKLRDNSLLPKGGYATKKDILEAGEAIRKRIDEGDAKAYQLASVQASILKISHGRSLIETQGFKPFVKYMEKLWEEGSSKRGSRAAKSLVKDRRVKSALMKGYELQREHPKMEKLLEIVKGWFSLNPESRVIVFAHYRDTANELVGELNKIEGVRAVKFVGQAKKGRDRGLSQKEQSAAIDSFKRGEINLLVATSVGEEGLDIPSTDYVIFYEPVPSEIRAIQRRGRTGRRREGKVTILITEKTLDEAYYWSELRRERRMWWEIERLREKLSTIDLGALRQSKIGDFVG